MNYADYNFDNLKFDRAELNERNSFWELSQKSYLDKAVRDKDNFIKTKLIEKGFEHLVEGLERRTFPKICMIKQDKWTYIYADDDTEKGAFIVAIQDYDFSTDYSDKDFATKMNFSFKWQDTQPLVSFR